VEKVPIHLNPIKRSEIKVSHTGELQFYEMIVVAGQGGNPIQLTLTRPIGQTPEDPAKTYVLIPSDSVPTYLSKKDNPQTVVADRNFNKARDDYFLKSKLFEEHDHEIVFKGTPVRRITMKAASDRDQKVKELKKAFYEEEAKHGRYPVGTPQNPGKGTAEKTAHKFVLSNGEDKVETYFPEDFKEVMHKANEAWKASKDFVTAEAARKATLSEYETLGGSDGHTPQKNLEWLRGVPQKQIQSYLTMVMHDPVKTINEINRLYRVPNGLTPLSTG